MENEEINKNETQKTNYEQENNKKTPKRKISILGTLGRIILIAVLILSIIILIRAVIYHQYDVFGYRFYTIKSGSMEPSIHVNDMIVVKDQNSYQKGDILVFNTYGSVCAHRIVETYTENGELLYQTKGDFNNTIDAQFVKEDEIIGKTVAIIPGVGTIIDNAQKNLIPIAVIAISILTVFIVGRLIINERGKK